VDNYSQGLRCQDVNAGLRTFDAASAVLTPMKKTRLIGMAADLASLIRDRELISDISALETVAAAELDIPSTSFDTVVSVLEEAELVELTRVKGQVTGLTSDVPYYKDLYETLGRVWRDRRPSQLEEEVLVVVDKLAHGPLAEESLTSVTGIEQADLNAVMRLGREAELIKSVSGVDGTILYSPYTAGSMICKGRPIGAAPPPGEQRPVGPARRQILANLIFGAVVKPACPSAFRRIGDVWCFATRPSAIHRQSVPRCSCLSVCFGDSAAAPLGHAAFCVDQRHVRRQKP
jgi:hypothetical protein